MAVHSERKTLVENKFFKKFKPTNRRAPFAWRIFRRNKMREVFCSKAFNAH